MKETIKIPFGVYYQEQFSKPMRRKQDVVSFILGVVNVLLVGESESDSISDIRINNRSVALLERMLEKIDFEESSIDEII